MRDVAPDSALVYSQSRCQIPDSAGATRLQDFKQGQHT